MNIVSFIFTLFFSMNTLAQGSWELVESQSFTAETKEEVFDLLQQHSQTQWVNWFRDQFAFKRIAGFETLSLQNVSVNSLTYQWVGESKCAADDPRLIRKAESGSYRYSDGSMGSWVPLFRNDDPCERPNLGKPPIVWNH